MIQAYATGTPIEVSPLNGDGAGGIVGYAARAVPHEARAGRRERSCPWSWRGLVGCGGGDDGPGSCPAPVLHHPVASYLALAAAPTGNGWGLFAVLSVIYVLCLLVAGWRKARREGGRRWAAAAAPPTCAVTGAA